MRGRGIDPDHVLHVRSFLDHEVTVADALDEEPSPADDSIHVGRGGVLLDSGRVLTNLAAHLRRWAGVAARHGLLILEVHSLPAAVVRANLKQSESLHFDAYHAFSRQHLVEADAFLTAAASVGLFARPSASRRYPRELDFTRISLNWFELRAHRIRHARPSDLDALCALEARCWPAPLRASRAELLRRVTTEPRGCWVLLHEGAIVGATYAQRIAGPAALAGARHSELAGLHDPSGAALQLLGLNVDPAVRNHDFGSLLLEFVLAAARLRPGIENVVGVSRCGDYPRQRAKGLGYEDYVHGRGGGPRDPVLGFHLGHGARIGGIISGYRPEDVDNDGAGVIVIHALRGAAHADAAVPASAVDGERDVRGVVDDAIARVHPAAGGRIDPNRPLLELGLDSMAMMELRTLLERRLGVQLNASFFFSHGTPRAIARALGTPARASVPIAPSTPAAPVPSLPPELAGPAEQAPSRRVSRVAIVGMACRFPGGARDPEGYWRVLVADRDAITGPPPERLALSTDLPTRAGFLNDVESFDADFFNIAPKEARLLDPQHRLVLETCWEALEDAGISPRSVAGSRTAVYTGLFSRDYERLAVAAGEGGHPYVPSGNSAAMASGRIAYFLDARGPAMSIDTACSSALVGVHLAVQSLRAGESKLALVSGVNLILGPDLDDSFRAAGMLAADGHCKTFDAAADGYVRAEGCATVVLERLDDAMAAGHRVLAVIEGSALEQDGASNGLTAPNGAAQEAVIRAALADAGVEAREISYIEAHGTGTALGDPVEFGALSAVFADRARERPLYLGSAKTQIGHTEAAAGLAGLLKVVLSMDRRTLPGNVHFRAPNPEIDLDSVPARVPCEPTPWGERGELLRAGVSSFGFSGTNAHVVLSSPPPRPERAPMPEGVGARLFLLSARSGDALAALAERTTQALSNEAAGALPALCQTSQVSRAHFAHRVALAADDSGALRTALAALAAGGGDVGGPTLAGPGEAHETPQVAVLFSGQGSHDPGAGRLLFEREGIFRAAIERCEQALADELPLALRELLFDPGQRALLSRTRFAQPALFALEYALFELWTDWGLRPEAVMGHSLGEYVAAAVAGVFEPMTALRLVAARGRLMEGMSPGGMLAVMCPEEQLGALLGDRAERMAIAARNGPAQMVVAGVKEDLAALAGVLTREGIRSVALDVSHAFHSPMVEPILDQFEALVAAAGPKPPSRALIGNLRGELLGEEAATPRYWRRHLRETVRFFEGVETLRKRGVTAFLECGPKPTLVGLARAGLARSIEADELGRLRFIGGMGAGADELDGMRRSLAQLHVAGVDFDWAAVSHGAGQGAVRARLPTYPFARRRAWLREDTGERFHPLLGRRVPDPAPGARCFTGTVSSDRPAYLGEHWVYDAIVVLGVTYLEMALAAASRLLPGNAADTLIVEDVTVWSPLVLRAGAPARLRLRSEDERFEIHSAEPERSDDESAWTRHATGRIARRQLSPDATGQLPRLDGEAVELDAYYERMRIYYGPRLRNIRHLERRGREAIGHVCLQGEEAQESASYELHPALLDACFQCVFALIYAHESHREPFVPLGCARIELRARGVREVRVHLRLHPPRSTDHNQTHTADLRLFDMEGRLVASVDALQLKRASKAALLDSRTDRASGGGLFEVAWQPDTSVVALPAPQPAGAGAVLDELARGYVAVAFAELQRRAGGPADDAESLGVVPAQRRQFARLRAMLGEGPAAADPAQRHDALREQYPQLGPELALLGRCGSALAEVLRGEREPLSLIFPDGALDATAAFYREAASFGAVNELFAQTAALLAREGAAPLRVLEVGAGTGGVSAHLLPLLPARCETYVFSDVSPAFLERAARGFGAYPALRTALLDVEADESVSAELSDFDLIVAGNVLHATADLRATLARLRARLRPGGRLVLLEGVESRAWIDLVFGLTSGWWRFADDRTHPLLPRDRWLELLGEAGFEAQRCIEPSPEDRELFPQAVFVARSPGGAGATTGHRLLIGAPEGMAGGVRERLELLGSPCGFASLASLDEDGAAARILAEHERDGVLDEVSLFVDDDQPADRPYGAVLAESTYLSARALRLIQALVARPRAPRLRLLTRGARELPGRGGPARPASAAVWGLGLVAAMEHPELDCRCIDVESERGLLRELLRDDEPQVALRDGRRWLARLDRLPAKADAVPALRPDGTYLITGGLGGLGRLTAQHLIERGARNLVLLTRDADKAALGAPELSGQARVEAWAVDVGDPVQFEAALDRIGRELPPLRGVIHAVGVLDDGAIVGQTARRFESVLTPKVSGAATLARRSEGLDFLAFFASAVGLVGSAGQANHAAANAVLDALAERCRSDGLPVVAIDWGPWAEVGAAVRGDRLERWSARGISALSPRVGLTLLDEALAGLAAGGPARVGALALQPRAPVIEQAPLFTRLRAAPVRRGEPARAITARTAAEPAAASLAGLRARPVGERRDALSLVVRDQVAASLGLSATAEISPRRGFRDLGMDSLTSLELRGRLVKVLGLDRLAATVAFDYPTIDAMTGFLADGPLRALMDEVPQVTSAPVAPVTLPSSKTADEYEPIAIIGAGCRMPGGVSDLDSLWALLREGVDAITTVPAERWDADAYVAAGRINNRYGGFLRDVDRFDAEFFGIAPREARKLDPQQRLLLEVAWEALENAGVAPSRLAGTRTGVFVGICSFDYALRLLGDESRIDPYVGTGSLLSPAAGRLSYVLGLVGPSMAVDTACSSSLLAVHLACASLRNGESDMALAGGVNCILDPALSINFSRAGMLSPDGRCKPFEAGANGFVRAEGCGVVVLKRLSDALASGDPIVALIRGSATNQDGRSSGLMAPSGPSQQAVLRRALADARVAPSEVGYIEAHGTGTALGDPIEAGALQAVFGAERARPLVVGSLKSNLGHMEGAAGVGGLLKTALSLSHRQLPPTLHFREPSPHIEWSSLEVANTLRNWPGDGPAIAGVSSFGFAGTNVHVVLQQAELPTEEPAPEGHAGPHLLVLSARGDAALDALAEAHERRLRRLPRTEWASWCRTAALGRDHMPHRLAVVAEDPAEAASRLARGEWFVRGRAPIDRRPRIGLWIEARGPVKVVGAGLRAAELAALSRHASGRETAGHLAVALDLSALWSHFGVVPDVLVGAGTGLLAAACLAGALDEEALREAGMSLAAGQPIDVLAELPWRTPERPLRAAGVDGLVGLAELRSASWWRSLPRDLVASEAAVDALQLDGLVVAGGSAPSPRVFASSTVDGVVSRRLLLETLGRLHVLGVPLRWEVIEEHGRRVGGRLPTYPWQKERFWEPAAAVTATVGGSLLGEAVPLADPELRAWTSVVSRSAPAGLCMEDHRVGDRTPVPASLYLELARRAGVAGSHGTRLRDVEILRGLDLAEDSIDLQLSLRRDGEGSERFAVYARPRASNSAWTRYATGLVSAVEEPFGGANAVRPVGSTGELAVGTAAGAEALYADAAARGLRFGPSFRPLTRAQVGADAAVGELELAAEASVAIVDGLHPVIWDGCMQLADALAQLRAPGLYLPVRIDELTVRPVDPARGPLRARATLQDARAAGGELRFDVSLFDGVGLLAAEFRGIHLRLVEGAAASALPSRWLVQLDWLERPASIDLARQVRQALDARAHDYIGRALTQLGWTRDAPSVDSSAERLGVVPRHRRLFERLVELARNSPPGVPAEPPPDGPESALLERCGPALADVLRGRRDPLELIFPGGDPEALAAIYRDSRAARLLHAQLLAVVRRHARRRAETGEPLRILEVGAGTGGTTFALLSALDPARTRYTFTDVGPAFVQRARERFAEHRFVDYACLDLDRDPREQGFVPGSFDLIIAANVVHATRDLSAVLGRLRGLLSPVGALALIEGVERCAWVDLCFGMTDGWWAFVDRERRPDHPLLSRAGWSALLPALGFERPDIPTSEGESSGFSFPQALIVAAREPRTSAHAPLRGTAVALIPDRTGYADALAEALRSRGAAVTVTEVEGETLEGWLRDEAPFAARAEVIHCAALDCASPQEASEPERIHELAVRNCSALVPLLARLRALPGALSLRLLTRGAAPLGPSAGGEISGAALAQAALWGVARVIPLEHPHLRTTCHDLDPAAAPAEAVAALAREIDGGEPDDESRVAYRGGARLVAQLAPLGRAEVRERVSFAADAGILITGGLGGLGLLVADWMVRRGARRLFLLSRGAEQAALEPRQREGLEAMRRAGAEVTLLRADAGDARQLADALAEIRRTLGGAPLSGVFHAAGVLDDGALANLDADRFARVLRPKLLGAWLLHQATLADRLEHFVVFSSAASLLGNAGQANHAAANAFLDALSVHRAALGLPARSIAWGPIAGVGAGLHHDVDGSGRAYRGMGMGAMTAGQALAAFEVALAAPQPLVGVLPLEPERARQGADAGVSTSPSGGPVAAASRRPSPLRGLATMSSRQRRLVVEGRIRAGVVEILGLAANARPALDRGFFDLGFDSLTSLELRERLEIELSLSLPAALLMLRPTLAELLDELVARLDAVHGGASPAAATEPSAALAPTAPSDPARAALIEQVSGASDESLVPFIDEALDELLGGES
ncbi:SDR family NAD(P)-dependent oxidoreductase [Archangium violaceum]|uniref:SDR family NAD(P)-dependent oxidoreductase n=1 Tax=Archangium violaceum TaxID=83451 RepID=UPI000A51C114